MEEYNEFGELIQPERVLPIQHEHRIHETKDYFDSDCYLCQKAMKLKIKTYWPDED